MKTIAASLSGAMAVALCIVASFVWQFARRPASDKVLHRPKISSLSPFGSGWDFMMFSAMILCFSVLAVSVALVGWIPADEARDLFICAAIGCSITLVTVLPLNTSVPVHLRAKLHERLSQLRYVESVPKSGVFVLEAPRFARWDSNRVTIIEGEGELIVTIPLLCLPKI